MLAELLDEYNNRNIFKLEVVVFSLDDFIAIPFETKHHLYRILQELLQNIAKHANAKKVSISITQLEYSISAIIEDDGIGFSDTTNKGIGLQNIENRLASLNGTLTIDSSSNGSTLLIDIPSTWIR